jgi:hypothetical protein
VFWPRFELVFPKEPILTHFNLLKQEFLTNNIETFKLLVTRDRLCGLVVRVLGCRSMGPGSISGAGRFFEKYWVWKGVHSAS